MAYWPNRAVAKKSPLPEVSQRPLRGPTMSDENARSAPWRRI
jgi:hypothetical protein